MTDTTQLDQLAINTIRTLSMDAVQAANSGHPGTPMALAPLVYTLWNRILQFDPHDPLWPNRDRKPSVTLEDIKRFRRLDSKAPGHPEHHWVSGVETTTGPLGQGIATSVGMAMAAKFLAARYNKLGLDVFDYNVYAVCGDGCLMEGVGGEAASLAGHLQLDNLCWIYDNNHITIEGNTSIAFTEDVPARFLAYGWNVVRVGDANDIDRIEQALRLFQQTQGGPSPHSRMRKSFPHWYWVTSAC